MTSTVEYHPVINVPLQQWLHYLGQFVNLTYAYETVHAVIIESRFPTIIQQQGLY